MLVLGEFLADLRNEFGQFLIQGEDFAGECGDDPFPHVLGGNDGVLGFRGLYCCCGDGCRGACTVLLQLGMDPGLAGAADPVRSPVFAQQQCGL